MVAVIPVTAQSSNGALSMNRSSFQDANPPGYPPPYLVPARPLPLLPLVLANAACMMAMMAFIALLGPLVRALGLSEWQAGATVTMAGLLWFLLARGWGGLSDRIGRKRVLLIGLGGFACAYLLLALGLHWALWALPGTLVSFVILLLGRGAVGAFYAAVPSAANAMVADLTGPTARAPAMAALGASGAVGMVLGPALAGLMAARGLVVPMYLFAVLPWLAIGIVAQRLPTSQVQRPQHASAPRLWDARLRLPVVVALVSMGSVTIAQICVGFYAMDRLGLTAAQGARVAGYALTAVGVALIVAQLGVRRLRWPNRRLIVSGSCIAALGFVLAALSAAPWQLIAAYFVAAAGMGFVFPAFSAAAADAVEAHEQGIAAGTVSAAQGVGMVFGPVLGGGLYALAPSLPYALAVVAMLAVALWTSRWRPRG